MKTWLDLLKSRLFGSSSVSRTKQPQHADQREGNNRATPPSIDAQAIRDVFTSGLTEHLHRVSGQSQPLSLFIGEYISREVISMLSIAAAQKMTLTLADSKEHSVSFSKAPVSFCICTIPFPRQTARQWFLGTYGGYFKLLGRIIGSDDFQQSECKVLVHIVFGAGTDNWVTLTILFLDKVKFPFNGVVPPELLTQEERALL